MIDLSKLAAELHEAAVAKGFWDVELATNKHINKLRSELGEVTQADRAGVMYEIEHDGGKPEGVAAELADFVMMTLDWMQKSDVGAIEIVTKCYSAINETTKDKLRNISSIALVDSLYSAIEVLRGASSADDDTFVTAMVFTVYGPAIWLEARGYDLWDIIRQKMEYNRSRPALHGRLY